MVEVGELVIFINFFENVISYEWDFGDGNIFIDVELIYVFVEVGIYIV